MEMEIKSKKTSVCLGILLVLVIAVMGVLVAGYHGLESRLALTENFTISFGYVTVEQEALIWELIDEVEKLGGEVEVNYTEDILDVDETW